MIPDATSHFLALGPRFNCFEHMEFLVEVFTKSTVGKMRAWALAWTAFLSCSGAMAEPVNYTLRITEQTIQVGDKTFPKKLTINGKIPGPELVFHEGDEARIRVINETDQNTLIHWHGILLPNDQDGVPFVNSLPIAPHSEKLYQFPLKQTGTYWYHSHVMFQEEDGLYGAIKILPSASARPEAAANLPEDTVLFADLSRESGKTIHRNLKKDGEYYGIFKGTVQSWLKAFRTGTAGTKFRNSLQRMEGMDYADVAYDFFTANGLPSVELFRDGADGSKRVKLRLINGSATSLFKVTFAGGAMTVIAADGLPVEPVRVAILPISVAETYDVIVDLSATEKLELRATSLDNSGFASVWIGRGKEKRFAPPMPYENPIGVTMGEAMGMPGMGFLKEFQMSYSNEFKDIPRDLDYELKDVYALPNESDLRPMMPDMDMKMSASSHSGPGHSPEPNFRIMNRAPEKPGNPLEKVGGESVYRELTYGLLRAREPLKVDPRQKLRIVSFTLNGNMDNYVWTINGRPLGPDTYIHIRKGERVRFVMKNTTMMNHPMHLHGHFFRVMTLQKEWSPLKHTVNVAPLDTTIIEFDATEEKDWFFHCHILYHMMDGMTRIVRYDDQPGPAEFESLRRDSDEFTLRSTYFLSSKLLAQSNYSRLEGKVFSSYYMLDYDVIGNYSDDFEGEIHAARTLTRHLSLYLGGKVEETPRGKFEGTPTAGLTWHLPLNIAVDFKYQPLLDQKFEVQFENEIKLTDRLQFNFEYSSTRKFYSELEYRSSKRLSFLVNYNQTYRRAGVGVGLTY